METVMFNDFKDSALGSRQYGFNSTANWGGALGRQELPRVTNFSSVDAHTRSSLDNTIVD